ncbi:MAG: enterochelin esterase family protein [Polyangiales bacterium]|jgi:enterochelin esterase family protein
MTQARFGIALWLLVGVGCGDDASVEDAAVVRDTSTSDASQGEDAGPALPDADITADATVRDAGFDVIEVDAGVRDPGTDGDGDYVGSPPYERAPELSVPDDVERGNVYRFSMDSADSEIYPGLTGSYTRDLAVYVPNAYVNGRAAPFMVVQDGGGYVDRVTAALDTMSAAGDLPPIVAIFINSGGGDGRGSQRGLEYDTVSDVYVTFIESEVLPRVLTHPELVADYDDFQLTSDPEGRGSMGCSSGGAAAFTMGWFRPDLYRRILTYSGTFVNQAPDDTYPASAWEYHESLIAEADPKPLRVFLQVGENDLNLDGRFGDDQHDWVAANRAMAAAFAAQDYHYRFVFSEGARHCDGGVIGQTLPETLRWLWQGYPIN